MTMGPERPPVALRVGFEEAEREGDEDGRVDEHQAPEPVRRCVGPVIHGDTPSAAVTGVLVVPRLACVVLFVASGSAALVMRSVSSVHEKMHQGAGEQEQPR